MTSKYLGGVLTLSKRAFPRPVRQLSRSQYSKCSVVLIGSEDSSGTGRHVLVTWPRLETLMQSPSLPVDEYWRSCAQARLSIATNWLSPRLAAFLSWLYTKTCPFKGLTWPDTSAQPVLSPNRLTLCSHDGCSPPLRGTAPHCLHQPLIELTHYRATIGHLK